MTAKRTRRTWLRMMWLPLLMMCQHPAALAPCLDETDGEVG